MISRLTTALLILGLLSLVTARPVSYESAKKQDTDINDLLPSDKELDDLFKRLFPSSNAKKEGFDFSGSITLPDGRTFEWANKQGRRIPFSKGEAQVQNAKQQGLTITLPGGSTYDLPMGEEQGRRISLPKEQSYTGNDLEDFLKGWREGWSHQQGRRVPFGKEQGRRFPFGKEQGRRVPFVKEQGRRVPFSEEQSSRNPWLNIYPYSGFSKEQGIRVTPSAKQQSLLPYNPGYIPFYAKQQGRRISPATAKQQDIQFPYPRYYYKTRAPISSKGKEIQAAIESIYNSAAIEALCSAASDKEKSAIVAAYVQQNFDNLFDPFQGFTNFCDLINGSGANGSTDKESDAKGLSKELNKLLEKEN